MNWPVRLATGWRPGYRGLRLIAASVPTSMRWLDPCMVMILALGWKALPLHAAIWQFLSYSKVTFLVQKTHSSRLLSLDGLVWVA